ncbi:hypothetical protein OIU78_017214 [Salix suchowensis]|uniref:Uncharacterized protein n=1 Tax=Salix koriyanagi TaxID=2511006 RepID=A0A9Q0WCQ9_9ROSI|nr:hypothetical protein OIU78_017214 [Salix suchowensis]KAJ6764885.1 hypothetical protein OIU74_023706 [Salix koriyanagi]
MQGLLNIERTYMRLVNRCNFNGSCITILCKCSFLTQFSELFLVALSYEKIMYHIACLFCKILFMS